MDDLERYGDYNEIDEPPKKNNGSLIIKIIAAVICVAVILVLGARIYIFNYYPENMKQLYFTPELTNYYNEHGGVNALTQKLLYPYDDNDEGNFFASNLIVVRDLGTLQIALRYNVSLADSMRDIYGFDGFDPDNREQFSFRLWRDGLSEGDKGHEVGRLVHTEWESFAMYRYAKLVFDGIDFGAGEDADGIEWIRLEIFVDGVKREEPFMILIYENHADRSGFDEYTLSKKELPK